MTRFELDRSIDAALGQLSPPRAPHTLLPRIMTRVDAWAARPWYSRAWTTWPAGWQVASMAALLAIVSGGAVLLPQAESMVGHGLAVASRNLPSRLGDLPARAALTLGNVTATTSAVLVLMRTLLEALLAPAFVVIALMSLACAAFGAALRHIVTGKQVGR